MKEKKPTRKKKTIKKGSLKIAQLHWGFPPVIGGVETHLCLLLPALVRGGHQVALLTGSVEGERGRENFKGVDIWRTPLMDLNWLYQRGLEDLEKEIEGVLSGFLKSFRPDIIHAHNMHYFSHPHAEVLEKLARQLRVPLVLTAHNTWDDLLFLNLTRDIRWSHIIAVSHYIKKELMGIGCDDRKITVVHHGIDTGFYRPNINSDKVLRKFPRLKGRKIVFHPARMGLAKGCDTSIKALRLVKKYIPDVLMVLAGTRHIIDWGATQQKDIAYLVSLVKEFNLEENVLIDSYTLKEMAEIYGLSHVCIYPSSVGEPFGLTMLEALSAAKPMIVTNAGGMPEIIKDGINGFIIPVKDLEVLASRIVLLLTDERLRQRLGYTGRQMVESHYTQEIMTKDILNIYRRLLSSSR